MMLGIEQPGWVWVAAGILLAGFVALMRTMRGSGGGVRRSRRWWMAGVVLPLLAAVLIALAGAGVSLRMRNAEPVVILLDLSGSARMSPWHDPGWVRALAEKRLGPERMVTVVGFGAGTRMLLDNVWTGDAARWPGRWADADLEVLDHDSFAASFGRKGEGTDLAAALGWLLPGEVARGKGASAPRWVITDGIWSGPPPPMDVPVAWTVVRPDAVDLGVKDIVLRSVNDDAANGTSGVEILAQLRAAGGGSGKDVGVPGVVQAMVRVMRDGVLIGSEDIDFHAGMAASGRAGGADRPAVEGLADRPNPGGLDVARWISMRDRPPRDGIPHRYEVAITRNNGAGAGEGDPWPENDHASAIWSDPGAMRVLVVGQERPDVSAIAGQHVATEQFFGDAARLAAEGWQLVVLDDVPAEDIADPATTATMPRHRGLPAMEASALDRFVRDTGGGLLVLGNGHAFGPGEYARGSETGEILERLSPVWSSSHDRNGLQVVFLVDASGSMNDMVPVGGNGGGAMERKFQIVTHGIEQSLTLLAADDRVSVIAFNGNAQVVSDGPVGEKAIGQRLVSVQPTGPTLPDTALEDVTRILAASTAPRKLVVFLTDGEIPSLDAVRWKAALEGASGTKNAAQLCIIAPSPAPLPNGAIQTGNPALEQLAAAIPETIWWHTTDPAMWGAMLRRAVAQQVEGRQQTTPLVWHSMQLAKPPVTGITNSWTQVWLKPEASLESVGLERSAVEPNHPLAAIVQRGLGKVGAIAMADDGSSGYRALRDVMMRELAANAGDRRFSIAAHPVADGSWRLSADGIEKGRFLDGQYLAVRLVSADSSDVMIALEQTGPGHYEKYVRITAPFSAVFVRNVTGNDAHGASAKNQEREQLIGRVQAPALETSEWPATVEAFHAWPRETVMLSSALSDGTMWSPQGIGTTISLRPWLWLAAAVMALAALWMR